MLCDLAIQTFNQLVLLSLLSEHSLRDTYGPPLEVEYCWTSNLHFHIHAHTFKLVLATLATAGNTTPAINTFSHTAVRKDTLHIPLRLVLQPAGSRNVVPNPWWRRPSPFLTPLAQIRVRLAREKREHVLPASNCAT